jgi:hypothetical protein
MHITAIIKVKFISRPHLQSFKFYDAPEWNPAEWNLKVMVVQTAGGIDKLDRRVELHILKMDKPK